MRLRRAFAGLLELAVAASISAGLAGCVGRGGVPGERGGDREVYLPVAAGEALEDVRSKWGEPQRVLTFKDERTGREEVVWQYESRVAADGRTAATRVTFVDGVVRRVERMEIERRPPDLLRPDSSGRRDGL